MKYRYKFVRDYSACPTGYAQTTCKQEDRKTFHKGDVVWGSKYRNSVSDDGNGNSIQGYALDASGYDIPLPPLDNSPVTPSPIFTIGRLAILVVIGIIIYIIVKVRE